MECDYSRKLEQEGAAAGRDVGRIAGGAWGVGVLFGVTWENRELWQRSPDMWVSRRTEEGTCGPDVRLGTMLLSRLHADMEESIIGRAQASHIVVKKGALASPGIVYDLHERPLQDPLLSIA